MHGEIKLKRWLPFTAEQVIRSDSQMMWKATVRRNGIPIRGFDRLVGGEGAMQWKVLGIVPVMTTSGPDITRSTVGRLEAESVWLPSALRLRVGWHATKGGFESDGEFFRVVIDDAVYR